MSIGKYYSLVNSIKISAVISLLFFSSAIFAASTTSLTTTIPLNVCKQRADYEKLVQAIRTRDRKLFRALYKRKACTKLAKGSSIIKISDEGTTYSQIEYSAKAGKEKGWTSYFKE